MLPILISLGPIKIYSYGVCMMIGFFVSLYYWWKMGRDEHWDEISLFDGFFLSLITFFVAGRAGYAALHVSEVGTLYRSLAIFAYPGINITIGVIATIIFMWLFARANSWHLWKVADAYVVVLSILFTIGSIGGLLNGSNPGREVPWGLVYPGQDVARIPVDIWIMIWSIITFAVVSRVRKNFRFYSWYKGDSSTAQEGLASLIFLSSVGVYYMVASWIDQIYWKVGILPGEFLIGFSFAVLGYYLIYKRVGRRDTMTWSKLREIKINYIQWLRKRRST